MNREGEKAKQRGSTAIKPPRLGQAPAIAPELPLVAIKYP